MNKKIGTFYYDLETSMFKDEELKALAFDEAKMLSKGSFKRWCELNPESYEIILKELNDEQN